MLRAGLERMEEDLANLDAALVRELEQRGERDPGGMGPVESRSARVLDSDCRPVLRMVAALNSAVFGD